MAKFLLLIFLLATCTAHGSSPSQSPSPAQSPATCADVVMGMVDCLGYIEEGSKESKPTPVCCNELKVVVDKSPDCLCEGLKLAPKFGIKLDMKKATGLPHACGFPLSDFGGCNATSVPSPSPVVPPSPPPLSPPPPVSQVPPPQHSPPPPPPVLPQTPPPKPPLAEPPAQISQPPAIAPSSSSSWKTSHSLAILCVGVAVAGLSFLHV